MKQIKIIVEKIEDEVKGAEEYAKLATKYKLEDKALADSYANMATQKLSHVDALHTQAVRLIKDQKATGAQIPVGMQAIWDWEHEKMVDNVSRIRMMLDVYRGK